MKMHRASRTIGLTLLELLVVIAIIGVLAGFLLPVLARGKAKARTVNCTSNIKQVGAAFVMYLGENNDNFPAPGSKTLLGPMAEDWIYWQVNRDVRQSAIAKYISSEVFSTNLFRCAADFDAWKLEKDRSTNPYIYSFSFTSYRVTNDVNAGMALALDSTKQKVLPFSLHSVVNPSGKIMVAEEDRKGEGLNDGRWIPTINPVSTRHDGKGNVAFVDGHVQTVNQAFGLDPRNSLPAAQ
ncbi:MAG: prepilin-type N-terminal cleavage/methylation domain-containing protein [Verrucomicrobia bacterium]|nr:prepilin-type N-terminal cleavage/methylation domain-containing protein [Verrucomicrobiota bacterium]